MGVGLFPEGDLTSSSLEDGTLISSGAGESFVDLRGRRRCCRVVASDLDRGRILSKNCFILLEDPVPWCGDRKLEEFSLESLFFVVSPVPVPPPPPESPDFGCLLKRLRIPPDPVLGRNSLSMWTPLSVWSESRRGMAKVLRSCNTSHNVWLYHWKH